jgi:hypothetical protein
MANWYGSARTNYVRLAPEVTLELLSAHLDLIGASMEVVEKGDRVAFLPSDGSEDGNFDSFLRPDIPDAETNPKEAADLAAALKVDVAGLDDGEFEFSWENHIMPFIQEGDVLVVQVVGAEKLRYLTGYSEAFIRRGENVERVSMSINDIYPLAAKTFGISEASITEATY